MEELVGQLLLVNEMENLNLRQVRRQRHEIDPFLALNDRQFIKLFRLTKELARFLIELLKDHIAPAKRPTDLNINTKILVSVRFLASGSYQLDVGSNYHFGVSQASVSRCLEEVVTAINHPDIFGRYVRFPQNFGELNKLRYEFYQKYDIPGLIGCIDCTHVAIFPPNINHENYPEHIYVNRKNYHSINVQLICDHNLKILNVNALYPGSTHDSFIWTQSNVQTLLRQIHNTGNKDYFLLGDSGYPLRSYLLTPLEQEPLPNTREYRYNSKHKTTRSLVERCNGVLKMRFRCLLKHRVLHYSPEKASKIINACVVLHNLCVGHNIPFNEHDYDDDDNYEGDMDLGMYNDLLLQPEFLEDGPRQRVNPELASGRRQRARLIQRLSAV